jgi:hypothetical protein
MGDDSVCILFGPKCSPNLWLIWGEMGCPGADTRLGAALGAVFGTTLSVWTKNGQIGRIWGQRWRCSKNARGDGHPFRRFVLATLKL